jgi:CheY-like chemotaxis protein
MRAVRELPGDTGRIPAIALTAFARPEDREHALDVGYQVHLPKPIELEALHESISILTVR